MIRQKSALAVLREQMGMTQMEMATRLGISQGELSYIETGQKAPSDSVRESLRQVFPGDEVASLLLPYADYIEKKLAVEGD